MELTLKMDDGTVIRSKQLEITISSMFTKNGTFARIGVSFLTDDTDFVDALLTEKHKKARFL